MSIWGKPALTGLFDFSGSGSIVSFPYGDGSQLKSLTVHIEPVQDLHGYDNPWPAGGGKNLINPNTVINDSWINITTGAVESGHTDYVVSDYIPVVTGKSYTKSGYGNSNRAFTYASDKTPLSRWNSSTITIDGDVAFVRVTVQKTTLETSAMVEGGSTATAFAPYSNICPISGWTGMNVFHTSNNIFGGTALRDGVLASMSSATDDQDEKYVKFNAGAEVTQPISHNVKFKEQTSYTFIMALKKSSGNGANLRIYYTDGTSEIIPRVEEAGTKETILFVSNANKTIKHLTKFNSSGATYLYYEESGVFEGALTVNDFTAYSGNTYPISWETEAGTVYGGTLDVTNGVLTVDRISKTCVGSDVIAVNTVSYYGMIPVGSFGYIVNNEGLSNLLSLYPGTVATMPINSFKPLNSGGYNRAHIIIKLDTQSTTATALLAEYKQKLNELNEAGTPLQIVYYLTTPVTYQLTPQQINTLVGQNNIWADTGDVDVAYSRKTLGFLSSIVGSSAKHYTVRWDKTNSQMVRLNDAKNITTDTANFKHSGSVNPNYDNPFDSIYPWSGRKLCNISLDNYLALQSGDNIKDCVTYWEGDAGFSYDNTDGVWVYTPEFWGKSWDDGTYRYFDVADQPVNGYIHYPEKISARWFGVQESRAIDGTAKNILLSKPGMPIKRISGATIHTYANNGGMTLDNIYSLDGSLLLYLVEYANYNAQSSIGNGVSALYRQSSDLVKTATTGNVVQVEYSFEIMNLCIPGAIFDIGTANGGADVGSYIIQNAEQDSIDNTLINVTLDRAVTVTTENYWSIHGLSNFADSAIGSMSGYIGSNGKADAYYRGEVLWGNMASYILGAYKDATEVIWLATTAEEADNYDALDTSVHIRTEITVPSSNGYIKSLGFPDSLGTLAAPSFCTNTPGNSANPVGDYFGTNAERIRLLRVGGSSQYGSYDGPFYWSWSSTGSTSSHNTSGRPLLKNP